ncbi:hypothetical protein T484DRAFT_1798464, partial [Baffinella frigidus]
MASKSLVRCVVLLALLGVVGATPSSDDMAARVAEKWKEYVTARDALVANAAAAESGDKSPEGQGGKAPDAVVATAAGAGAGGSVDKTLTPASAALVTDPVVPMRKSE